VTAFGGLDLIYSALDAASDEIVEREVHALGAALGSVEELKRHLRSEQMSGGSGHVVGLPFRVRAFDFGAGAET
jgi:hypothetical protein